jgi:aspartate/methionine/tyrosine aminotransferase
MMGVPELRQAVAAHSARHAGLPCDWQAEVVVTSGATEALAAAFLALLNAGDEVIFFEPLYDSYLPMARRAGAVPR